ncbi:hypothetical protein GGI07_001826 [Coemansia sp. Benny D115]|nr:hypothetical protein GGI07_001826 [Coemansia sp. Benny D115]
MANPSSLAQPESPQPDEAPASSSGAIVTACSFLVAQADLEREAAEVLPGKFDDCTFDQGYIRQPLYACLTCTTPPTQYQRGAGAGAGADSPGKAAETQPAGMCYSCSIECHPGHDIVELFTKRGFRCDCGTKRLAGARGCCHLKRMRGGLRDVVNEQNRYGHNFWGYYCWCDRFYDFENEQGAMIQCYVCNDWFHETCIGEGLPNVDLFDDYICRGCVAKHRVLRRIDTAHSVSGCVPPTKEAQCTGHAKAEATQSLLLTSEPTNNDKVAAQEAPSPSVPSLELASSAAPVPSPLEPNAGSDGPSRKKQRLTLCRLRPDADAASIDDRLPLDLFLSDGWKQDVCTCLECMRQITEEGLSFILGPDDIVEPEDDDTRSSSLYEAALQQMRSMDHSQAIDAATAYHALSASLKDFLRPFASSGKVVTDKDIHAFFDRHNANSSKP